MQDEMFEKIRPYSSFTTCKDKFLHYLVQIIKFFDIFGAKPMLNAEP